MAIRKRDQRMKTTALEKTQPMGEYSSDSRGKIREMGSILKLRDDSPKNGFTIALRIDDLRLCKGIA